MPRIHFHQQLAQLKDKVLAMASMAQDALETSVEAYLQRDPDLAAKVIQIEREINTAERKIDEMAYELLAKEQPMAIDLRFILAVIKINGDLERVGDQSVNIAERGISMRDYPEVELPIDVRTMGEHAGQMIRLSIKALLEEDAKLAESVLTMDDEIDAMNSTVQQSLMTLMQQNPEVATQALNAGIISRNLERSADHATNIAEDVIFWVRGSDVRHKISLALAD